MTEHLRILNLEDSVNDAELIREELSEGGLACDFRRVENREEFIAALACDRFDLVLADYSLPAFDGLSALSIALEKCPDTPFIFVSGSMGEDVAIEALKNNATDYVLKNKLSRLAPAVRRALRESGERKERRDAEQALRESERKYKRLVETTVDGIFQSDADNRFTFMNAAGARMFGCASAEEMMGRPVLDFWAEPKDREAYLGELKKRKTLHAYPLRGIKKNGEVIYLEMSSHILEDVSGRFLGAEGILRDVTEKIKLEEQLRQAQKMEAVGQLTGGIAHDFNNILSAIIGYASLMQMKMSNDDPFRSYVEQILAGTDRAANLTRSLLTFSRKQLSIQMPVDVNELVGRVDKLLRSIIGEDIDLRLALAPGDLIVNADAGQVEQILMNLATNARDAMQKGGILSIETMVAVPESAGLGPENGKHRKYALISVADTGVGMDEKTKEKIFEPFFTTKDLGRGTGLGLSMVYGIIKQHHGDIHCYSEPRLGTTFKIYLPLLAAVNETLPEKAAEAPATDSLRGTETILVAEDDATLRTLAKSTLEGFGYEVITAVDGKDAVERFLANRNRVRLILCDVVMPRMSGGEVRDAIRRKKPDARFLFTSGYPADIIQQKSLLEEDDDVLLKPLTPSSLLQRVREALDKE